MLLFSSFEFIVKLFNIFSRREYPLDWTNYYIVFTLKANFGAFCHISFSNFLFKILEKIIYSRLEWWFERSCLLLSTQFKFCRGRSIINNLIFIISEIKFSFARDAYIDAIFLNIRGAFDNVVPDLLIAILKQYHLLGKIIYFIRFVVFDRKITSFLNGEIVESRVARRGLL